MDNLDNLDNLGDLDNLENLADLEFLDNCYLGYWGDLGYQSIQINWARSLTDFRSNGLNRFNQLIGVFFLKGGGNFVSAKFQGMIWYN